MLAQENVIRAWKDPMFRSNLGTTELATLPAHPAGLVELSDDQLMEVNGGTTLICIVVVTLLMTCCSEKAG